MLNLSSLHYLSLTGKTAGPAVSANFVYITVLLFTTATALTRMPPPNVPGRWHVLPMQIATVSCRYHTLIALLKVPSLFKLQLSAAAITP